MRLGLTVLSLLISTYAVHAEDASKTQKRSPNQVPKIEGETQLQRGQSMVYCVNGQDLEKTAMTLNSALVAEGTAWKWPNSQGEMIDLGIARPFLTSAPAVTHLKDTYEICVTLTKQ